MADIQESLKATISLYFIYSIENGDILASRKRAIRNIYKSFDDKYNLIDFETFWVELQKDNFKYLKHKASSENEWFYFIQAHIDKLTNVLSNEDKASKITIIKNLIYIGYLDSLYSSTMDRIVTYIANKWSIEKEVMDDIKLNIESKSINKLESINTTISLYFIYSIENGNILECKKEAIKDLYERFTNQHELIDFETFWAELQKNNTKYLEYKASSEDEWFDFIKEDIDKVANILSNENKATKAGEIWNLIYIGYLDSIYSNIENKIVTYLANKWSIEKETLDDFVDIEDTIVSLHSQLNWTLSTYKKSVKRDKKEKEITARIAELDEDVQMTAIEVTI